MKVFFGRILYVWRRECYACGKCRRIYFRMELKKHRLANGEIVNIDANIWTPCFHLQVRCGASEDRNWDSLYWILKFILFAVLSPRPTAPLESRIEPRTIFFFYFCVERKHLSFSRVSSDEKNKPKKFSDILECQCWRRQEKKIIRIFKKVCGYFRKTILHAN